MKQLILTRPDDWHCHVRDEAAMQAVVPFSARQFGRVIIMPNLRPPVTSVASALAYRQRIIAATKGYPHFNPLMTLYLTDNTDPDDIAEAAESEHVVAVKYYPAGATTNSDSGVTDFALVQDCLAAMQEHQIPLLLHGEVTNVEIDIFDRETQFIHQHLSDIVSRYPTLKVVLEHITTKDAVDFVLAASDNVAATITPQHLLLNRNDMLVGGIKPHHYCLPVLKRETHRKALVEAATSGNSKFFLGTDSAPHSIHAKETSCGCAGIFSAHAAIELYAMAFEQSGALDKLEGFASHFGADFYGLPRNSDTVTLAKQAWQVPDTISFGNDQLVPFFAGNTLSWKLI